MGTRASAWVFALVLCVACGGEQPRYLVELEGTSRFHLGDDPAFAAPDLDDTAWSTLTLPATWRAPTFKSYVSGWHRFHFELAEPPAGDLAIDVGAIAWSDEVFLNGQRVGGTGRFDGLPRLGLWPRLYPLPDGVLRQGTNVLAIRVRGVPIGVSGLFARRIGIADELTLTAARARALSRAQVTQGLLFGFMGTCLLLVAFFPKRGRAGRATLALLVTITLALVMLWLIGVSGRETGGSLEVGANVVLAVASGAACSYWAFVAAITRGRIPASLRAVLAGELVLALGILFLPAAVAPLAAMASAIGVIGIVMACRLIVGAIRARVPGAVPIAVGCVSPPITMLGMMVLRDPFVLGLPVVYYGIAASVALAALALTMHVHELNRQVERATEYALDAHARERSRLARDLHDGLGQMLALLKLQMQRMGRRHAGEPLEQTFAESADQIDGTIEELRRIARDLRPVPLEDRSFGQALREYAAAMAQRTDLEVRVDGEYDSPPRESVGAELYRIAQECLTNCLKHSGARRVVVTLSEVGDRQCLTVTDDGRGLPAEISAGLGLGTIRERSELLGGSCTFTSPPGGGLRVEVTVPR